MHSRVCLLCVPAVSIRLKEAVRTVMRRMVANGANVSRATYQLLLDECWAHQDSRHGLLLYRNMREQGIVPSEKVWERKKSLLFPLSSLLCH